ncbi:MAG: hypothetical protein KKG47_10050 [Proteobacteria bacterium]|nr:hypothetical protein [Pseudomonadota bacterium]MBU1736616.1 hypothetical protein [Pseudomonadota bacterium]
MSVETSCWEITGCNKHEDCAVFRQSELTGLPCWEVVSSLDDYRNVLNVCGDCVVYVMKQTSDILSAAQIDEIMARKGAVNCCAKLVAVQ